MSLSDDFMVRCRKLGLECDEFPTSEMSSVLAALACFPMHMVANVDAWTNDTEFRVPVFDLPGAEKIREAFVLGMQEADFDLIPEHRQLLLTLVGKAKPSDLVIYEYALETLQIAFRMLSENLTERVRREIARSIVAVAKASGEGLGGSGPKVTPQEQFCIDDINEALRLDSSDVARTVLEKVGKEPMSY